MINKKVKIEDLDINYLEVGKGLNLVFLHGWGGSKDSWLPIIKQLDLNQYHCLAVDMPGFGESDRPNKAWHIEDYVAFLENFLAATIPGQQYALVVHSFGGRVAIKHASAHPPLLTRMILIAAAAIKRPKTRGLIIVEYISKFVKKVFSVPLLKVFQPLLRKTIYKLLYVHDYETSKGTMVATFLNSINEDLTPYLPKIKVPALIVWGTMDRYVPVIDAGTMLALINQSQAKIIRGGTHNVHQRFAKKIVLWIDQFIYDKQI